MPTTVNVTVYNEPIAALPHPYSAAMWTDPPALPYVDARINQLEPGAIHAGLYWPVFAESVGLADLIARLSAFDPGAGFFSAYAGVKMIGIDGMPPWLAWPGLDPQGSPPTDYDLWRQVVQAVVARFGPECLYQIWNEPDGTWQGPWGEFGPTFVAAQDVIRAAGAKTVGPELNDWNFQLDGQPFMRVIIDNIPPDVLSWHAYEHLPRDYDEAIAQMRAWGYVGPLAVTEANLFAGAMDQAASHEGAAYMAHVLLHRPDVDHVVYQAILEPFTGDNRGTFTPRGVTRPSYQTYRHLKRITGQAFRVETDDPWLTARAAFHDGVLRLGIATWVPYGGQLRPDELAAANRKAQRWVNGITVQITLSDFNPATSAQVVYVDEAHVPSVAQTNADDATLVGYGTPVEFQAALDGFNDARDQMADQSTPLVVSTNGRIDVPIGPRAVALVELQ